MGRMQGVVELCCSGVGGEWEGHESGVGAA